MFNHRDMNHRHPRRFVGFLLLGALGITALGFLVMSLWNALLPALFGLKVIHFWQALGLLALSRILFGGFHHRHSRGFGPGFGPGFRHRQHLIQRWENMTPEEREKFREGMRGRFGGCRAKGKA